MGASILLWQALALGILQGLTEFLPISSSAHLILLPWVFRWDNPLLDSLTFDVALHVGTLLAILWYFWRDWVELIAGFFRILLRRRIEGPQEKLIVIIILATMPAGVAGLLLEKAVESTFRNPLLIAVPLVLVSLLMIFVEARSRRIHSLETLTLTDGLIIGVAQAAALLPGVSRSGITITTGLFLGYKREAATRFSFLLSTPAIGGAALLHFRHLSTPAMTNDWPLFTLGIISSALVGYLAIAFLMRYLRNHTLNVFAGYRLVLAGAVLLLVFWKG